MRILLVATNQTDRFMDRMVVRPVPIGLAYIAAAVDEDRHQMRVLDLMFSRRWTVRCRRSRKGIST